LGFASSAASCSCDFLQTLLGYPALQAGIALSPRGIGRSLAMPLVGMIIAGSRRASSWRRGLVLGA